MPTTERRRVPVLGAFVEGWRRVAHAPVLVLGTAIAVASAGALFNTARPPSTEGVLAGYVIPAGPWGYTLQLFYSQARNLAGFIAPEFAHFFDLPGAPPSWIASLMLQAVLWLFLSGGILDRLARGRPVRSAAFFAACGVYFFRFLRLILIAAIPGWGLFRLQQMATGNLGAYLTILLVVMAGGVVVEFAKVRTVVEDRLSAFAAAAAGFRFVRRRFVRVFALTLLNAVTLLMVVRLGVQVYSTPGPGWLGALLWMALSFAAVVTRLAVMASQVAFFQGELAHAGYTAAPIPQWPDSPAVEALENLSNRGGDRPA